MKKAASKMIRFGYVKRKNGDETLARGYRYCTEMI